VIVLAPGVWSHTIAQLRACGRDRNECVAYFTGPVAEPTLVDEVVHPKHQATAGSYELDDAWLHEFWVQLYRQKRAVRVQVHTHGAMAFHSYADDQWPIVHTPGFCSLVIPNFARRFEANDLFLVEIDAAGAWQQRGVPAVLTGLTEQGVDR
jgi:hypothetical protein